MTRITSSAYKSSVTQVRPANTTAYDALDVVSNSTSAPAVLTFDAIGPTRGTIVIQSAILRTDVSALPSGYGAWRLHLYTAAPTAINDGAAFNLPSADRGKYAGYIEFGTALDLGDTLWAQVDYIGKEVTLVDGNLYGILQTVNGFTPTSAASKYCELRAIEVGR